MPLTEIRSSMAGTVSTPSVQLRVGQTVSPGDMIAVVRDLSSLKVEVLADEAAADTIQPGQAVKIRLWGRYGAANRQGRTHRHDGQRQGSAHHRALPF